MKTIIYSKDEIKNIQSGDMGKMLDSIRRTAKYELTNHIFDYIDNAATNPIWRSRFTRAFNRTMGSNVTFQAFDDEEKEEMQKNYTITGGVSGTSISGLFETNILPIVDGLIYDNSPILSRVNVITDNGQNNVGAWKLNQFSAEQAAGDLDEDDAGTEADDTPRTGDTLTPDKKIQASTSFTEYAMMTMSPDLLGQFVAKLIKRVQNRLVLNILAGTDASNQFKGIINSAGSTEDNQMGALAYTTGSGDNINKLLQMIGNLPDGLSEDDESRYVFITNRSTWYNMIRVVQNVQNDYKIDNLISEGAQRKLANLPVLFAGYGVTNNRVILGDLSNYYLIKRGEVTFKTDDGLASVKTGNVTAVARVYADGGMVLAHKNAVGSGAGASDNQARNAWRFIDL